MKKTFRIISIIVIRFMLFASLGLSLFLALDYINNLEKSIIVMFVKNNTRLIIKICAAFGFGIFFIRLI